MKTNPGAKKRFSLTGTGKIKRKHAYKSHILTKKSKKRKRNLTYTGEVHQAGGVCLLDDVPGEPRVPVVIESHGSDLLGGEVVGVKNVGDGCPHQLVA